MARESSTKFTIPKSIPMKYHTIALENIYALMGFLADGILATKEGVGRLEVQVDHTEQELSDIKNNLSDTESRLTDKIDSLRDETKKDIKKLNQEVFG